MIKCFVNKRNCPGFFQGECLSIENCQFQWEDEEMNRRKTKTIRELTSDINKRFNLMCENEECSKCDFKEFREEGKCKIEWLKMILGEEE